MTRQNGALRIFLYNWPVYLATWSAALATLLAPPLLALSCSASWMTCLARLAAGTALVWSFGSLLVSFYVYDRSPLVAGRWIAPLLGSPPRAWATVHAGLDAEIDLDTVMPGRCIARLDIFDDVLMTSPSIKRARARTVSVRPVSPCRPTSLPLGDGTCDAIIVAFTAHEVRDTTARERFFAELRRSLCAGGTILVVEHLRDTANFFAFGPGYLHFVPRREWLRLAQHAGLEVASDARITPWVMALALRRSS